MSWGFLFRSTARRSEKSKSKHLFDARNKYTYILNVPTANINGNRQLMHTAKQICFFNFLKIYISLGDPDQSSLEKTGTYCPMQY